MERVWEILVGGNIFRRWKKKSELLIVMVLHALQIISPNFLFLSKVLILSVTYILKGFHEQQKTRVRALSLFLSFCLILSVSLLPK